MSFYYIFEHHNYILDLVMGAILNLKHKDGMIKRHMTIRQPQMFLSLDYLWYKVLKQRFYIDFQENMPFGGHFEFGKLMSPTFKSYGFVGTLKPNLQC